MMEVKLQADIKSDKNSPDTTELEDKIALSIHITAIKFNIPVRFYFMTTRGKKRISFARQLAQYIAHTVFSLNFTQIGHVFGRDRTSVSYAVRKIEDLRDNPEFDRLLETFSKKASEALKESCFSPGAEQTFFETTRASRRGDLL